MNRLAHLLFYSLFRRGVLVAFACLFEYFFALVSAA